MTIKDIINNEITKIIAEAKKKNKPDKDEDIDIKDPEYTRTTKSLDNPLVKNSIISYKLYGADNEKEKSAARSDFAKKAHKEINSNGTQMHFNSKEIKKINLLLKNKFNEKEKGYTHKKRSLIHDLLRDKSLNLAQIAYKLYNINKSSNEIDRGAARSLFYKKKDRKKNKNGHIYDFNKHEVSKIYSILLNKL